MTDNKQIEAFNRAYARYLEVCCQRVVLEADDDRANAAAEAFQEAVWCMIRTPAGACWQIRDKLRVVEELLGDGDWVDRREFALLHSAYLDLANASGL